MPLKNKDPKQAKAKPAAPPPDFLVVGIGGSAGAQEPIQTFFQHHLCDRDAAYILVQHLSPEYRSLMPDILARYVYLPIVVVQNGTQLEPNTIYIIPDSKGASITKGAFKFSASAPAGRSKLPIDKLFSCLAKEYGEKAVGIILSGADKDGSAGLRAIKEAGGLAMVQAPDTAQFNTMPEKAIELARPQFILPPAELAHELNHYLGRTDLAGTHSSQLLQDEETVKKVLRLVLQQTGLDFGSYKSATLKRRMARRMALLKLKDVRQYFRFLSENPDEVQELSRDFLIGVTRFFRDAKVFESIEAEVLPDLVRRCQKKGLLKLWVVACSTGEEAYTLAMLVKDYLDKTGKQLEVKIFATDIDQASINVASKGVYTSEITNEVSGRRLERYFSREGEFYVVRPELRRMVIFSNHNIFQDPPFFQVDLVTCRNLLIYMQPGLQARVLRRIHFSLNLGGYLVLGSNEAIGEVEHGFELVDKRHKIYRNREVSRTIGSDPLHTPEQSRPHLTRGIPAQTLQKSVSDNRLAEALVEAMVERYRLACVYIDEGFRIIHAVGDFNKYLQLPDRRFSLNLLKMVSNELSIALGTAVRKALKERERVFYKNIRFQRDAQVFTVSLQVQPVDGGHTSGRACCMIIFYEEQSGEAAFVPPAESFDKDSKSTQRILDLEHELTYTQENLQSTIEELETSNEELQSSNEELLASNEELQSTNEELQSVNEKLHTVNSEYQIKIKELAQLNDDINNLLKSTNIGTLFLDLELNIRRFTPSITALFNLIESDIGRPITHISSTFKRAGTFAEDIRRVIDTYLPIENEVRTQDGTWYLMRILPYITREKTLQGVVITFVDISEQKRVHRQLAESNAELKAITEQWHSLVAYSPQIIMLMDADLTIRSVNHLAPKLEEKGLTPASLTGKSFLTLPALRLRPEVKRILELVLHSHKAQYMEIELEAAAVIHEAYFVPYTRADQVAGIIFIAQDITDRKALEENLARQTEQLNHRNKELEDYAYIASHDLKAPVTNLQSLLEIFQPSPLDDKNRQILDRIYTSVDHMRQTLHTLNQVIALKKSLHLKPEPVPMQQLFEHIFASIDGLAQQQHARIETDFRALPEAHYPPIHLQSILQNLLTNALKYAHPERNAHVEIKSGTDKGFAYLSVKDNGLGIDLKRNGRKLFGLFKRFHTHIDGDGIGLYMVQQIVQSYGGRVEVESKPDEGSTFCVYLYPVATS